jgi:hypothetical protein
MSLSQIVWLDFDYMNKHFEGEAIPVLISSNNSLSPAFEVYFNNEYNVTIVNDNNNWSAGNYTDQNLLKIIFSKLSPYLTPAVQD